MRTGSLLHLGQDKAVTKRLVQPDVWFVYEVIAEGDRIELRVNGETVTVHNDTPRVFAGRSLGLELDFLSTVQFRKIEIKKLASARREAAGPDRP